MLRHIVKIIANFTYRIHNMKNAPVTLSRNRQKECTFNKYSTDILKQNIVAEYIEIAPNRPNEALNVTVYFGNRSFIYKGGKLLQSFKF